MSGTQRSCNTTGARIKASDRRKQFLKYINEGKVDEGYYVIDKGDGKTIQIRRSKAKPVLCDVEVQTQITLKHPID